MDHSARMPTFREGIHTQQRSPFFRLPSELRDKIYTEIIDAIIHSTPPISFLRSDDPREGTHKHDRSLGLCELSATTDTIYPKLYQYPGSQLLRICQRANSDIRQLVTSRKASGKPTISRIDAIALDEALTIPRATILPHWPDHGRNMEIHIEISCEVTYRIWDDVSMTIAMGVWGNKFMKRPPTLNDSKTTVVKDRFVDHDRSCEPAIASKRMKDVKSPLVEHVIFSIRHCMDECEDFNEKKDRIYYIDLNSGKNSSGHPVELEVSGQQESAALSDEKPICAHLLQLVAQIRAACPFHQTKQTFVIRGHHHSGVPGSPI